MGITKIGAVLVLAFLANAAQLPSVLAPRSTSATMIPLGVAGTYTVVAKTGVSTVPSSSVTGNIGIAPAAMTYLTGFSFTSADASVPSTSSQIKGLAFAPETIGSTSPQAALDMVAAYNNGAAQGPADFTELKGGALDGLTLTKGIYKWGTTVVLGVGQTLTLSGACGDVFIFQAAGAISTGANSNIKLVGGLQSNSIFWVGATALTTGVSSNFAGIILTYTNVVIGTSAALDGAIYTQTEAALHMATITPPKTCDSTVALVIAPVVQSNSAKPIPLGAAGTYTVVAKTGISTVPASSITGNIGIAPAAMTYITGFSFVSADASIPSTSSQIKGLAFAPETIGSTSPQAALDIVAAYNNGAAQGPADFTELKGGALDGLTLTKGIYKWGTTVVLGVGQTLTLSGACGDVFIFQAAGAISTGAASNIKLVGGVQSNSIFWVGATSLTTGVSSQFAGIILTYTNVVIGTSATLDELLRSALTMEEESCPRPTCVVCLGLGSVAESSKSQDQLVLFQELVKELEGNSKCPTEIYDPVTTTEDTGYLTETGYEVLNSELTFPPFLYQHSLQLENTTFMFMPHCPRTLFDDLLRKNWTREGLSRLIIFGNRLDMYNDPTHSSASTSIKTPFIAKSLNLWKTIPIPPDPGHIEGFNDLALQWIPLSRLADFWEDEVLSSGDSQELTEAMSSEVALVNRTDYCPETSAGRAGNLTNDFTRCTDWTSLASTSSSCVEGMQNEPNCGYGSSQSQLCDHCNPSNNTLVQPCCISANTAISSCGYTLSSSNILGNNSNGPALISSSSSSPPASSQSTVASPVSHRTRRLSKGALAGAIVGSILGALLTLLLLLGVCFLLRRRKPKRGFSQAGGTTSSFAAPSSNTTTPTLIASSPSVKASPAFRYVRSPKPLQAGVATAAAQRRANFDRVYPSGIDGAGRKVVSSALDLYTDNLITADMNVKAIFTHNITILSDELEVNMGDVIWVTKIYSDDWADGLIEDTSGNTRRGCFPLTCVTNAPSTNPPSYDPIFPRASMRCLANEAS
ncbi:hypothetical protein P7C70_g3800, partial [Phenoliferia sp. Uapishka_3]